MPKFLEVSDVAAAREYLDVRTKYVDARSYGVVGDGTTDDTEALQAWIDDIVSNSQQGWLPNGTYKITDTLVTQPGYGWKIHGENRSSTKIRQFTDNIPVFKIGTGTPSGASHGVELRNMLLEYDAQQPSTNTNANCLVFDGSSTGDLSSVYFSTFETLQFRYGYYAMSVASGRYAPWGCRFDNLSMTFMSGGMLDHTDSAVSGCPNNYYGRMTMFCDGAVGPIFKNIRGYNTTIEVLEFLVADQGPQLFTARSGFTADITAMKLEIGTYTGAGKNIINFSTPSHVRIGSIEFGGATTFTPSSGILAIIGTSGSSTVDNWSDVEIGSIIAYGATMSGNTVLLNLGSVRCSVRNVNMTGGWTLQATGGSASSELVMVNQWINGAISGDKGDADYAVQLGDPNIVTFNTAFTAQRTVTLPAKGGNNIFNGLYYDLIFDGAINGSNTAVIKEGANTLRTQSTDGVRLRYMWRRKTSAGQWYLVDAVELDTTITPTDVQVFTANGTWTKPAGAKSVQVRCVGPGGGGGAGARGPSGTALSGGGGGSSGGMSEMVIDAADLASTVSVVVGTGGVGAAGQTSDDTAGAAGGHPTADTRFGTHIYAGMGRGGGGGGLGVAGSAGPGTSSGWSTAQIPGGVGGAGSATGAAGSTPATAPGGGGGGGGGGITAAPAATAGATGARPWVASSVVAGSGGSGANGGDGASSAIHGPGSGGGGGGGNTGGAGYDGGAGGDYGAGGGGGGASLNGSASGSGGNGGDGICVVVTYF